MPNAAYTVLALLASLAVLALAAGALGARLAAAALRQAGLLADQPPGGEDQSA